MDGTQDIDNCVIMWMTFIILRYVYYCDVGRYNGFTRTFAVPYNTAVIINCITLKLYVSP